MKELIRLDALIAMRDVDVRARPRLVVSILLREKYMLIHYLVKMRAKIPFFFSLNVSFCQMLSLKVNNDVI